MLVFLDLETTGLDPNRHHILEVAAIITDDKFVELVRFHGLVTSSWTVWSPDLFHAPATDEFVRNMHTTNGLWDALRSRESADAYTYAGECSDLDKILAACIRENAVLVTDYKGKKSVDRPQLAGNTISFDRAFMQVHLPRSHAELHYRNLDLSSFNEMARRFWPELYKARPSSQFAHRAMADAEESLALARYYRDGLCPFIEPAVPVAGAGEGLV